MGQGRVGGKESADQWLSGSLAVWQCCRGEKDEWCLLPQSQQLSESEFS